MSIQNDNQSTERPTLNTTEMRATPRPRARGLGWLAAIFARAGGVTPGSGRGEPRRELSTREMLQIEDEE
ncbi:MAG: hypothetical protein IAE80_13965 [Anaerolinea sp.]|nr:hypothetical protein [Anaerolinea sp.]